MVADSDAMNRVPSKTNKVRVNERLLVTAAPLASTEIRLDYPRLTSRTYRNFALFF